MIPAKRVQMIDSHVNNQIGGAQEELETVEIAHQEEVKEEVDLDDEDLEEAEVGLEGPVISTNLNYCQKGMD